MVWTQARPVQGILIQPMHYDCGAGTGPLAALAASWWPLAKWEPWGAVGEEEMLTHKVCEQDDERS